MSEKLKKLILSCAALFLLCICSCSVIPGPASDSRLSAYRVADDATLLARYAPVFVIENEQSKYNRIGTPYAEISASGEETIAVSPERATLYTRMDTFAGERGQYTNLLYRIHFEQIPGGFFPFYLGKGRNIGLLVIVTLDSENRPLLYTSVHTCGCYLAFVPTSYMPADVYPAAWKKERQMVYAENLPGLLAYAGASPDREHVVILLRDATHRVGDMWLADSSALGAYTSTRMEMQPFSALERLPLPHHATTSFYETSGPRKDYVKGSHKIWERLFMSWWAFDWRIGEDKKLGKDKNDGRLFYTSLKPWSREASDLRNFINFSKYWGWKL